jgi:hypothetical protein
VPTKTAQRNCFGRKQGYKHANPSTPSLRTGHFSTAYPHKVVRWQVPLAFAAIEGVYPRVFEFFSIRQFFSHYCQPHIVKAALGEVLLYMFQWILRSEYVNNQYACLYHRVRWYIRNLTLYIHTRLPVCQ